MAGALKLALSIAISLSPVGLAAPVASTPAARLLGRVNPATNELSWPGTGVKFAFTGTGASVEFSQITGTNSITWIIDNGIPIVVPSVTTTKVSTPALPSGHHTVTLYHRSEALYGSLFYKDVTVNGTLTTVTAPSRRIEYIGDSITVGYGEGATLPCTNTAAVEDAPDTYGVITAKNVSADFSLVAWSGRGMTRNYVQATTDTSPIMPELWTRYGANDADNSYTFPAAQTPQAVVINLGTNDFSYLLSYANGTTYDGRPPLNITTFEEAYLAFVKKVQAKYPNAKLFITSSPMLNDSYPSTAEAQHTNQLKALNWVVSQLKGKNIQVVDFPSEVIGQGLNGCDDHPAPAGHQAMADILIPAIKKTLGW